MIAVWHQRILATLMFNVSEQPQMIPLTDRVTGQRHQLTAAQRRQVRVTLRTLRCTVHTTLYLETTHCRLTAFGPVINRLPLAEMSLPIRKHHAMPVCLMFKVIMKPMLGAQALNELQIRFAVLRAEVAKRVIARQFEAPLLSDNAVLPEHLIEDLWHCPRAENTLAETLGKTRQPRAKSHVTEPER
jgi:hypothetical protein